jgi:hypothetical protein
MRKLCRGPSIDASYQVSVYLGKRFREEDFVEIDQSETRIALSNEPKHGRMHLWELLYDACSFRPDTFANMTFTGDSCF